MGLHWWGCQLYRQRLDVCIASSHSQTSGSSPQGCVASRATGNRTQEKRYIQEDKYRIALFYQYLENEGADIIFFVLLHASS